MHVTKTILRTLFSFHRTNLENALVILGSFWLINGMLSFFMVEYEEENDDLTEEESDAGKIQSPNQRSIMKIVAKALDGQRYP